MRKISKAVALIMAAVMVFTGIPMTAFAAEEPKYLSEMSIDNDSVEDGAFYFTSSGAELEENAEGTYLLKIARKGEADSDEAVKLTMLDVTAKYGIDYTIKVYKSSLFESGVENTGDSLSIKEFMSSADGQEYNYSDAIIDGTITAEDQLTEEEEAEETEKLKETIEENKEEINSVLLSKTKASPSETVKRNQTLSLSEAKELMTGIADDKEAMEYSEENGLFGLSGLSGLDGLDGAGLEETDPYLSSGKEQVGEALSSAYVYVNFPAGVAERYIEIIPIDNKTSEGDRQAEFSLESYEDSLICKDYADFTLVITDDEEYVPDTVEFSDTQYYPSNGYVTVTVERSGNCNEMAYVMLDTEDITATVGVNYSAVHTKVIFSYGMKTRTVKIPVRTVGLTEDGEFLLKLQANVGCLIGEKNEAVCTIRPEDESFESKESVLGSSEEEDNEETEDDTDREDAENENQQLLGAAIKNDGSVLLDADFNLSEAIGAYAHRKGSAGSDGSSYKLVADSTWVWQTVWAGATFSVPGDRHYDWNGYQVEWKKECKSKYVTKFTFYNAQKDKWQDIYNKANKSFGKDIDNYFIEEKEMKQVAFDNQKDGVYKSTLTIYRISPIKRIFDITPVGSEPIKLIDENGNRKANTEIPGCATYGLTKMENTVNGVLTAVSGDTVTVQLADLDPKVYIKGLKIVNLKTKESRVIQTFPEGTRNASVKLTSDLIRNNVNYIEFVKNQSVGGLKGKFGIQAEIAPMPATVKVKNDSRYKITLWDGKDSIKTGTEQNGYTVYHYNVGDSIRCSLEMNDGYKGAWEWNQIDVKTIQPAGKKPEAWKKEAGKNYTTRQVLSTEVELSAEITSTKNRIVVMVPNSQHDLFDTGIGIFASDKNPTKDNNYTYYSIAEGSEVSGVTYELKAAVKDNAYVPVWQEKGKDEKYSQPAYCFTANSRAENNYILLGAEKADTDSYTIKGHLYYEDTVIGSSTSSKAWYPAGGVSVLLDQTHFGISDNAGDFETMRFAGIPGYYVKLKVNYSGGEQYKIVRLSGGEKKTVSVPSGAGSVNVTVNTVNMENTVLRAVDQTRPHISTVHAYSPDNADSINVMICQQGDVRMTRLTAYVETVDPNTGKEYEQTYTYQGKKVTETEKPVAVEFVVLDPTTKKEKSVYKTEKTENDDGKTFSYSMNFQTGSYNSYQSGDLVFARLVTNKKSVVYEEKDNEKKEVLLDTSVCAMVNTGLSFVENLSAEPQRVNINFPTEGLVELPIIGELSMVTDALGLSFGITETPERGVRLMFGVGYNWKNSHFDGNGKETSDTGFEYGLSNFTQGFTDMQDMLKNMGEKNALGKQAIGIPAWSFKPYAGIYFEFSIYNDPNGVVEKRFLFTGGGGYIGASATFRYTYYMLVYGIPVYVGGDVNLTLTAEFGVAPNQGANYALNDPTQDFFDDLIKNSHFDFVFRATVTGNAYAGVGVCGTLGLRGGFSLILRFINNPTIKKKYSDMRATGFAVTGQLKFWADVVLLSVPIPAYTWDVAKFGYFEDLDEKKKNDNAQQLLGTDEEETAELPAGNLQIIEKPRQQETSTFVANEDAGEELLGSSYSRFSEKTILKDSYDQPAEKLLTYTTADGSEKMLMVYLDDDKTRKANARTKLMYTVYDNESKSWTEPKAVDPLNQNAALSPELVYMEKEDQILISWISRKEALPEKEDYSAYLSTTQVFTARFDINNENSPISGITCMTDDQYLNANPKMICAPDSGDVLLYFLKSEVPSGITTPEELLKASMPQQNKANIAYFLYDGDEKKWITDKYYPGELADPAKEQILLSALKGQRFIPSKIEDLKVGGKTYSINNPVVSDYDVDEAVFYTLSVTDAAKQFETEATEAERESWKDPESGEENYWRFMKQRRKKILEKIRASAKIRGIYAFVVDANNDMDDDGDREIFIQTYDFEKHTYSKPIRLTENTKAESDVQLIKHQDTTYLFWVEKEAAGSSVQNGKAELKYFELGDLTDDTELNAEKIRTADIRLEGSGKDPTFSSYQVFSDTEGNITIAWQETDKAGKDETEEDTGSSDEIFSNSIYLAGLYNSESDEEDPQEEEGDFSWSDGILLEYRNSSKSKVFDSLQFASFDSESLLMVSNQYVLNDSPESYEISESELTMTTYRTIGSVYLEDVSNEYDFMSEEESAIQVVLEFKNGGILTAKGFNYRVDLLDQESKTVGSMNGRYDKALPAGTTIRKTVVVPFSRIPSQKEIVSLRVNVEVTEDETTEPTSVILDLFGDEPYFEFDCLVLEHDGEDFILEGSLFMDPEEEINLTGNEILKVYGSGDELIKELPLLEMYDGEVYDDNSSADPEELTGGEYEFEIPIPLSKLKLDYGFEDLTVVVEKEGKVCSDYGTVRGYYDNPVKLLLNGQDSDTVRLRIGEKLVLNGSCSPKNYYTNAEMLFAVEDETVADLQGNVLKGLKAGQTELYMSTDPYGGAREITVIVSGYSDDDSDGTSVTVYRNGPSSAKALSGSWKQAADGSWYFLETAGSKATGWGYTGSGANKEYFHFNGQGVMDSGWIMDTDGTWYYLHEDHDGRFGAMDRGWHKDASDGKWYYLDLTDGKMKTGWINVGGYWYYLSAAANEPAWVQDEKKRWVYKGKNKRSYGSMYENEKTPDGYTVDKLGRWVK